MVGDAFTTGTRQPFYRLSVMSCMRASSPKSRPFDHEGLLLPSCAQIVPQKKFYMNNLLLYFRSSLIRKLSLKESYIHLIWLYFRSLAEAFSIRSFFFPFFFNEMPATMSGKSRQNFLLRPKRRCIIDFNCLVNYYVPVEAKKNHLSIMRCSWRRSMFCSSWVHWSSHESNSRIEVALRGSTGIPATVNLQVNNIAQRRRGNCVVKFM